MFCGDFRQVLPIVHGSRVDTVAATLRKSPLWQSFLKLHLTENMRHTDNYMFKEICLNIGDGVTQLLGDDINAGSVVIQLPALISNHHFRLIDLINEVYPDIFENYQDLDWFNSRCLLTVLNETSQKMNDEIMEVFPAQSYLFLSVDRGLSTDEQLRYPVDLKNGTRAVVKN